MRKPPEELLAKKLHGAVRHVEECGLPQLAATLVRGTNRERGGAEGEEGPAGAAPAGRARDAAGDSAPLLPRRPQVQEKLQSQENSLPLL